MSRAAERRTLGRSRQHRATDVRLITRSIIRSAHALNPDQGRCRSCDCLRDSCATIQLAIARSLKGIPGVSDVRPRRWWVRSPDVHVRFQYQGREYVVWEPHGDNSRWWIGPEDENAPHVPLDEVEGGIARS